MWLEGPLKASQAGAQIKRAARLVLIKAQI